MANGTITAITENGVFLSVTVTISGAIYTAIVKKSEFDALPTTLDKQNYIINLLSSSRRNNRLYENIYATFIGNVLVIPD